MKKIVLICMLFSSLAAAQIKVVDGDSLEMNGERIRLDGIDAPEFSQICHDAQNQEYECGQTAKAYLQDLTTDSDVQCNCLPDVDKYQRKICECFINATSLNRAMVTAGMARAYRNEKYRKDEEDAAMHKRGLWQGKHMRPALYRILHRYPQKTK